jgi:hypothetical protein
MRGVTYLVRLLSPTEPAGPGALYPGRLGSTPGGANCFDVVPSPTSVPPPLSVTDDPNEVVLPRPVFGGQAENVMRPNDGSCRPR